MLATIRLSFLLFISVLLFSCATIGGDEALTPAQVLEMQEREETIIKEQLSGRKLESIEGIWIQKNKSGSFRQSEAFYKRGDIYIRVILSDGDATKLMKISENEFNGTCYMTYPIEVIEGDLEIISIDDNSLAASCTRKNYITKWEKISTQSSNVTRCWWCRKKKALPEDIRRTVTFIRVWPENLKEHNSQY